MLYLKLIFKLIERKILFIYSLFHLSFSIIKYKNHDFAKFSSPLSMDGASTVRRIISSVISQEGNIIEYRVEGNAFLPHQVRRMVGALVDVGRKMISTEDLTRMINCNSDKIAHSLPPQGLNLEEVRYDGFPPLKQNLSCLA